MVTDINIAISTDETTGALLITDQTKSKITQYDNRAQRLVFQRPAEYADSNLYLVFSSGYQVFTPQNIGQGNSFLVVDGLTQGIALSLQVFFVTPDGAVSQYSSILCWNLRHSLNGGSGPTTVIPSVMDQVAALMAQTNATLEDLLARAAAGEFDGQPGQPGRDGTSVTILGAYDTYEDLAASSQYVRKRS